MPICFQVGDAVVGIGAAFFDENRIGNIGETGWVAVADGAVHVVHGHVTSVARETFGRGELVAKVVVACFTAVFVILAVAVERTAFLVVFNLECRTSFVVFFKFGAILVVVPCGSSVASRGSKRGRSADSSERSPTKPRTSCIPTKV